MLFRFITIFALIALSFFTYPSYSQIDTSETIDNFEAEIPPPRIGLNKIRSDTSNHSWIDLDSLYRINIKEHHSKSPYSDNLKKMTIFHIFGLFDATSHEDFSKSDAEFYLGEMDKLHFPDFISLEKLLMSEFIDPSSNKAQTVILNTLKKWENAPALLDGQMENYLHFKSKFQIGEGK